MILTPITDKIIAGADACPETRVVFLIKHLANQCKEFERQLAKEQEFQLVLIDRVHAAECDIMPNALKPIETAPKDADGILAYSPSFYQNKGGWVAAVWHRDGWHSNPGGWRFEPTHWMPFPDAPPTVTSPHHKGE